MRSSVELATLLEQSLARIDQLEIRLSFLDELADSLDQVVTQQTQQLLALHTQMQLLYQRLESVKQQDHGVAPFIPNDDRPPHY